MGDTWAQMSVPSWADGCVLKVAKAMKKDCWVEMSGKSVVQYPSRVPPITCDILVMAARLIAAMIGVNNMIVYLTNKEEYLYNKNKNIFIVVIYIEPVMAHRNWEPVSPIHLH